MHVAPQPRHTPRIRRVAGAPRHALAVLSARVAPVRGLVGLVHDLEGRVPRDLGAHGGGRHAGVEAVGLLGDGDLDAREDALQLGLVGGGLADGVDVDLLDAHAAGDDALDDLHGGVKGLGVEVVGVRGAEHARGNVAGREGADGVAARGGEVGGGAAEGAHEGGAHGGRQDLGVVEMVMGPSTGPRPASSIPRQTAGESAAASSGTADETAS
ncbi:hypothetical protein BN1708_000292 [Verticillium longisporum]|uniref:Uncharacterized protein n=1 Tax=Verticillium longisporum TaxID=100787 RepID=A0A0G4KCJ9_VERLO|nr:hypothetical protein BN1708_000292 [Verticillium longisporum]